jgi:hypothetical protein
MEERNKKVALTIFAEIKHAGRSKETPIVQ